MTSAGAEVVGELAAQRQRPSPANYIGVGKVEELAALVEATEADLVIFDGNLSPSQERNLEKQGPGSRDRSFRADSRHFRQSSKNI